MPTIRVLLIVALSMVASAASGAPADEPARHHHVVLVLDGLRPDYLTRQLMPNLHSRVARVGVSFERHHSVFPTVTRVNASSLATGAYPERHGLLGNTVYLPGAAEEPLSTSERANLERIDRATGGRLLEATSLGEVLHAAGERFFVGSSGSSGSAFLLNHRPESGGLVHVEYVLPESLGQGVRDAIGPAPVDGGSDEAASREAMHSWVIDAYLRVGIDQLDAVAAFVWLSEPDGVAHDQGIGSPAMVEALARVDRMVARLLDGLEERGLAERTNLWVTSDHGFSTHVGGMELGAAVEAVSAEAARAGGAIYLPEESDAVRLAARLQQDASVGALFSRALLPASIEGRIPGTLSFDLARFTHQRAGDLLVSADWSDAVNGYGWAGATYRNGVAGHGSTSPWDIHATLVAVGPDLKRRARGELPTANVDLAPTILGLLGLERPPSMQGRVLSEALRKRVRRAIGVDGTLEVETLDHTVEVDGYRLTATVSKVIDGFREWRYLDGTRVERPD